jgi:hypothetical protein
MLSCSKTFFWGSLFAALVIAYFNGIHLYDALYIFVSWYQRK